MNAFVIRKRFLHIYEVSSLKVIISAPEPIVDFVLCSRNLTVERRLQSWQVVVVTSNCVYLKEIPRDITNEAAQMSDGDNNSNQSIFTELLDQNEDIPIHVSPISDNVILLESRHILLCTDYLLSHVEVVGQFVLTLSSDSPHKIRAYELKDPESQDGKVSPVFELVCPSFQFASSVDRHAMFVVSNDGFADGWIGSSTIFLPSALFAAVFKSEAALLQSTIILYSLNGCVFFHQVKSLSQSEESWQILCDTEGSVKSLLHVLWKPKDDESDLPFAALDPQSSKCNSGLLVCSSTGKTIYMYKNPTNGTITHAVLTFPGPVVSCKANKTCVYHCTGRRIYKHVLKTNHSTSGGDKSVCLETELLHECWVEKFVVSREQEDDQLLCQSPGGDILTISAQKDTRGCHTGTHSFRELLKSLDDNNTRLVDIRDKQTCINEFLHQVSIAGHLLLNKSDTSTLKKEQPVSCTCSVSSVKKGYKREYELVCKLTNHGALALSHDWSLMVVMETQNQSHTETRTQSMPLSHGLKSGSMFDVRCPIDVRCLSSIACDVKVYLVLYSYLLGDLESFRLHAPVPETSSLSLPVPVTFFRLDILHYLQEPIKEVVCSTVPSVTQALSSLVNNMPMKSQGTADEIQGSGCLYTVNIWANVVKIPEDCDEMIIKADSMAIKVLKYLLKDTQVDLREVVRGHLQLVDPHGHLISIAIATDPQESSGGERLEVQLGSEQVELLAQCRMAIIQRLKAVTCEDMGGVTVKEMRQFLSKMESLKEEVGELEDHVRSSQGDGVRRDVASMYEKLRKIQL